jgi:hypothetical protein
MGFNFAVITIDYKGSMRIYPFFDVKYALRCFRQARKADVYNRVVIDRWAA